MSETRKREGGMPEIPVVLWTELDESRRTCVLRGKEHHHLCRVLRRRVGDELELRDGSGLIAQARLERVEKKLAKVAILSCERQEEPDGTLRLALPLLKGRRLDWALEKGTELGVAGFHLYHGERNVVRSQKAPARYTELITAAFCQSHRIRLPDLQGPGPFEELLARARQENWRIWWADETLAAGEVPDDSTAAADREGTDLAWIGPEGGFSAREREALDESGARALSLGPRRLRSETAALALACQFLLPGGQYFTGPR